MAKKPEKRNEQEAPEELDEIVRKLLKAPPPRHKRGDDPDKQRERNNEGKDD